MGIYDCLRERKARVEKATGRCITLHKSQQNYLKSYAAAKRLSDISSLIYHERELSGWMDLAEKMDGSKPQKPKL